MLAYAQIYQEDLVQRLKSKLSGNLQVYIYTYIKQFFTVYLVVLSRLSYDNLIDRYLHTNEQRAVWHWLLNPLDRYAVLANAALKKGEPDYQVILEISCIESADELLGIKRAYQLRYKHSLEEDVASHTAADIRKVCFKNIFRSLVLKSRILHSTQNFLCYCYWKYKKNNIEKKIVLSERNLLQKWSNLH